MRAERPYAKSASLIASKAARLRSGMISSAMRCVSCGVSFGRFDMWSVPSMRYAGGDPTFKCRSEPSTEISFFSSSSRGGKLSDTFVSPHAVNVRPALTPVVSARPRVHLRGPRRVRRRRSRGP